MDKQFYSTPETAKELGVSSSHVRNMIRTGIAQPVQRIGNSWMFTTAEIERLRGRKRRPGKERKVK